MFINNTYYFDASFLLVNSYYLCIFNIAGA